MAQPYRKNAVYGSLAYDLDALVRERQLEEAGKLPSKQQPAVQEKPLPRRRPQARAAARPSPLVAGGVVVLLALLSAVMLYSSYYLGGRSIYLMRRLPDGRQTLRRQVWTAPLVWAVCAVAAAAVVLGLCYLAWRFITPEQCIPTAENIQRVMNAIAASPYSHYYG